MSCTQFHVDLDNLWVYERELGVELGAPDLIYERCLPRLLDLFDRHHVQATFFVIGRDLESLAACREFCRLADARGHEIANHSYSHSVGWASLPEAEKAAEIRRTHELISEWVRVVPSGFRAPGYFLDDATVRILAASGYLYDSSVLPGWGTLLMEASFRLRAKVPAAAGKRYGRRGFVFASTNYGRFSAGDASLFELPISVCPWIRTPIHSTFIYSFGRGYFDLALKLIDWSPPRTVVYLLHAVDVVDFANDLRYPAGDLLPARWSLTEKLELLERAIERLPRPFVTARRFLSEVVGVTGGSDSEGQRGRRRGAPS